MTYFSAFFKSACKHFSDIGEKSFDFVKAFRFYNPVAVDLAEHLLNFFKHVRSPEELIEFAVLIIVSSLFLDSYLPNTYRKSSLSDNSGS
jgi:hypothetical protein